MGKIYKLNAGGSVGVSLNKQMKAAGYVPGKEIEWIPATNGWLLKIVSKPQEEKKDVVPAPVLETI